MRTTEWDWAYLKIKKGEKHENKDQVQYNPVDHDKLTSSYTSLTAAPLGSSWGSIPPPGTIHWSG